MSGSPNHTVIPSADMIKAKFGELLESVPDAVVMSSADGRIVMTNAQADDLFGYARGELLGQTVELLMPKRLRTSHHAQRDAYSAHPAKRSMGTGLDLMGLRKNGSEFPVDISLSPLRIENATVVMSAIRDTTESRRIQKELEVKNAALEAANQELQAFSYSISHDLRAPLRAMDAFSQALKKSLGPQPEKASDHALQRINENIARMQKLIDGLLDFSSLTWIAVTKKSVDLRELVKTVFEELNTDAAGRHVELKLGKLPRCHGDPVLLRQVYANLLSNALKFTRGCDPAVIQVSSHEEKGEIVYSVQDNGAGFDMDYAEKLFRVFQRLHSAVEFEGTGVGLAIVQRIIQRHGGRVWAVGEVDHGATFYFTLGESHHGHSA